MITIRQAATAAGLALSLGGLAACSGSDSGAAASRTSPGGEALQVVGPFEVHSLDPAASNGVFTRMQIAETLVASDLDGGLTPGLATGWESDAADRTWRFELPEEVTFHDGSPVTPEAVADSLTTAAEDAASPLADAPPESIEPTADGVEVRLSAPTPTFPATLTHYSTAVLAPAAYDDGSVTAVIGTGPYAVDEVELPASVRASRFDDWRGEAPEIERVDFQAVGRAESRALMATSDQADVVFGLEPAGREQVEARDSVAMESSLQPRVQYLKVNGEHPALGDERVRRALSLAIDRESVAMAVLREPELAATQLFPPSLEQWHAESLDPLEHDPEQAEALFEEAGWSPGSDGVLRKGGEPLRLTLTTYPDRPELPALATALQAELAEVGVELEVDVTNSSAIPAGHADDSLELGLLTRHFALVADPLVTVAETFAAGGDDWGAMNWSDPAVVDAVRALQAGTTDAEAEEHRATIAGTVQNQLPVIPVAWYRMNAAVQDRVTGFELDPLEHSWHLAEMGWT